MNVHAGARPGNSVVIALAEQAPLAY
jgi:hypothetical protein